MFLDEELYQIGCKYPDDLNDIEAIKEMIDVCFQRSRINMTEANEDKYLSSIFKRINTSWNIAIDKLNADGKHFVLRDGFLLFLLYSDKFKCVHPIIREILN